MKTTKALMIATLAVSAIGMTPGISRASECGMGDVDWYSGERARVSRADSLLDDGQPREAAAVIESTWPRMREARPVAESLTHIADAVRIMALACVRSDGDVGEGNGWTSKTEADRASNVRWGISRAIPASRSTSAKRSRVHPRPSQRPKTSSRQPSLTMTSRAHKLTRPSQSSGETRAT
jgi:hypothetical protein